MLDWARATRETVLGACMLAGLVARSGFRLRGRYWTWRLETALGAERRAAGERARAAMGYARWMARMREISR
jgi:hypothetical protein